MTTFTVGSRTRTAPVTPSTAAGADEEIQDDGEIKPSRVSDQFWLQENAPGAMGSLDGKWMLFYWNKDIDAAWVKAKMLLRRGLLTGISAIKVSTSRSNPRASDKNSKVLIFYCGPPEDEVNVLRFGGNLVAAMNYRSLSPSNSFVYYKSDAQTMAGTRATGQNDKNHLYKIRVPPAASPCLVVDPPFNGVFTPSGDDATVMRPSFSSSSQQQHHLQQQPPQQQQQQQRNGKRKLETADVDVEETRKRMSNLSPTKHLSENHGSVASSSSSSSSSSSLSSSSSSSPFPAAPTTRIKFRLENVSSSSDAVAATIVATFHVRQRLAELVGFLTSQMPLGLAGRWMLLKTFPTEELSDLSATIEDAGLANAVVIARRM